MRRTLTLSACLIGALFLILAPAASACTQSAYTECIPSSGGSGGSGGGGGSTGAGGVGGVSTSSQPSSIPTSGSSGTSSPTSSTGSGVSQSTAGDSASGGDKGKGNGKQGKPHKAIQLSSATPSTDSGGGGVPTIAWILIVLALAMIVAGSVYLMRSRRAGDTTAGGSGTGSSRRSAPKGRPQSST
jgi:cobalamin biosynthesis Mg chelatase CobN